MRVIFNRPLRKSSLKIYLLLHFLNNNPQDQFKIIVPRFLDFAGISDASAGVIIKFDLSRAEDLVNYVRGVAG